MGSQKEQKYSLLNEQANIDIKDAKLFPANIAINTTSEIGIEIETILNMYA